MKFFKKKETLTQNMAFMAIMAAINIIVSLIAAFSLIFSVFIIIFLPLISVLVTLLCKTKYYPIYLITTIGLCLVATLWNIGSTIFYVVPAILSGFVFGLIIKKRKNLIWGILFSSLLEASLTYATIPLINLILDIDLINNFKTLLGLSHSNTFDIIFPSIIFALALIEMSLSSLIIINEIAKFDGEFAPRNNLFVISLVSSLLSLCIIGLYFLSLSTSYFILFLTFFFMIYLIVISIISKNYLNLILYAVYFVSNIVLYVFIYSYLKENSSLLLFGITPLLISSTNLIQSILKKDKNKE